jgi:hypothetical protein
MTPGSDPAGVDALLAARDRLLRGLRRDRVAGVISAGLGRRDDRPAVILLVRPRFTGAVPDAVDGIPVVVREAGEAAA